MATILHLSPKPIPMFAFSPKFLSPLSFTSPQLHLLHNRPFIHRFRIPFSSFRNGSPPETECPVPQDQQPINEYQSLSTSFPFSWASCDIVEYASRLFATGATFALFVGLPVSWFGSVGAESEPLKRVLCAASSGLFVVTLAVLRMYLGWAYVGNRLLSATVEYEETGWYDGQIWVKTAEILARDRLLGSFSVSNMLWQLFNALFHFVAGVEAPLNHAQTTNMTARYAAKGNFAEMPLLFVHVKPVLSRLKYTLVSLGTTLFICALILINIDGNQNGSYMTSKDGGVRVIPGAYNDDSARSFEPDAFCGNGDGGEPDLQL